VQREGGKYSPFIWGGQKRDWPNEREIKFYLRGAWFRTIHLQTGSLRGKNDILKKEGEVLLEVESLAPVKKGVDLIPTENRREKEGGCKSSVSI